MADRKKLEGGRVRKGCKVRGWRDITKKIRRSEDENVRRIGRLEAAICG